MAKFTVSDFIEINTYEAPNKPETTVAVGYIGNITAVVRYSSSPEVASLEALKELKQLLALDMERLDHAIASVELAQIKKEEE